MLDTTGDGSSGERRRRPIYRAYRLRHDGGIASAEVIQADDDDEAKALAKDMINGHGVELWERDRFVASYPPLEATGAAASGSAGDGP